MAGKNQNSLHSFNSSSCKTESLFRNSENIYLKALANMSEVKKTPKSKFANEMSEFLNESQLEKSAPKKRAQKRQKNTNDEDDGDLSKLMEMYQASTSSKKKKNEADFDSKESKQKILEVLGQQMESRKTMSAGFLSSLLEVINQSESDYEMLKENEQKLEHFASVIMKCIKQTGAAQKQNLKALKDIHGMFKKEFEQMESTYKAETNKLADELEADMNRLQQQLVAETKRKQFENLRRTIFHAIQNDL